MFCQSSHLYGHGHGFLTIGSLISTGTLFVISQILWTLLFCIATKDVQAQNFSNWNPSTSTATINGTTAL